MLWRKPQNAATQECTRRVPSCIAGASFLTSFSPITNMARPGSWWITDPASTMRWVPNSASLSRLRSCGNLKCPEQIPMPATFRTLLDGSLQQQKKMMSCWRWHLWWLQQPPWPFFWKIKGKSSETNVKSRKWTLKKDYLTTSTFLHFVMSLPKRPH